MNGCGRHRWRRVLSSALWLLGSGLALGAKDAGRLLPAEGELPGWKQPEPVRTFAHDQLFDLIDGGAELYHEYGFVQAVAGVYERGAATTLQVEIYRMNSPAAAFGVYSLMQSPKGAPVAIGQAARLFPDYLVLWQGAFYVSLTMTAPGDDAADELMTAARQIAGRIAETGEVPELAGALPREGLEDTKYFRGPIGLSNVHVFGAGNVFGVTEGVCGFYPAGRRYFVFAYASPEEARTKLTAAAQTLAKDKAYHDLAVSSGGFEGVDSDSNRIDAAVEGSRIVVRVVAASAPVNAQPGRNPGL